MIKLCKVITSNEYNTVVDFDGANIQLPTFGKVGETAYIKEESGRYSFSTIDDYKKSIVIPAQKKAKSESIERKDYVKK